LHNIGPLFLFEAAVQYAWLTDNLGTFSPCGLPNPLA